MTPIPRGVQCDLQNRCLPNQPLGGITSVQRHVAARTDIAEATRLPVHNKTLVIVSDDRQRIVWAAASDGWVTDYRPGSSSEMG